MLLTKVYLPTLSSHVFIHSYWLSALYVGINALCLKLHGFRRSLPEESGRGLAFTIHPNLALRLAMSGAVPPLCLGEIFSSKGKVVPLKAMKSSTLDRDGWSKPFPGRLTPGNETLYAMSTVPFVVGNTNARCSTYTVHDLK